VPAFESSQNLVKPRKCQDAGTDNLRHVLFNRRPGAAGPTSRGDSEGLEL